MSGVILSVQNDFVRMARTLKDKKGRTQQGAFLVEGVKCVGELLAHQPSLLRTLVVTEDAGEEWVERVRALGRHAVTVAPHVMAAICDTKTPQAVAAVAALPEPTEISRGVIVDGLRRWIPTPKAKDASVWSGLRKGDRALIRTVTLGPTAAFVEVTPFEGVTVRLPAPPQGATHVVSRDGSVCSDD